MHLNEEKIVNNIKSLVLYFKWSLKVDLKEEK
jgi:hypothetical protein